MGSSDDAIRARLADHAMYLRDRQAWARLAAPRWIKRMRAESEADKQQSWRIAGPELKAAIRDLIELEAK